MLRVHVNIYLIIKIFYVINAVDLLRNTVNAMIKIVTGSYLHVSYKLYVQGSTKVQQCGRPDALSKSRLVLICRSFYPASAPNSPL